MLISNLKESTKETLFLHVLICLLNLSDKEIKENNKNKRLDIKMFPFIRK